MADTLVEGIDIALFRATPDLVEFVLAIAKPTALAPGNHSGDRVLTLGRNDQRELVITSLQRVADGNAPDFPAGTVAVVYVRHAGECQPPHGRTDGLAMEKRMFSFFVDYRGETVWELGAKDGFYTFWQVNGANGYGAAETFNIDPAKYTTYPCAKYE